MLAKGDLENFLGESLTGFNRNRYIHDKFLLVGRVEMWRGGSRSGLSVAAPFVWRCPSNLAVTPFPHPAHRTGHADRPHPALGQNVTPSLSPSHAPARGQAYEPEVPVQVRERIAPALALPNLVLVA